MWSAVERRGPKDGPGDSAAPNDRLSGSLGFEIGPDRASSTDRTEQHDVVDAPASSSGLDQTAGRANVTALVGVTLGETAAHSADQLDNARATIERLIEPSGVVQLTDAYIRVATPRMARGGPSGA